MTAFADIIDAAEEADFSGVVTIDRAGERRFEHCRGFAHRAHRIPITPTTRLGLASGGKEVTAEDVRRFVMVHSRNPAKPKLQELFDRFDTLEEIQHFVEGEYLKYKNHLVS